MKSFRAGAGAGRCISPSRLEEFSEVVTAAAAERTSVDILGGGTQTARAEVGPESGARIGLSTLGWTGVDQFEPDEGVVHVRCGTRVSEAAAQVAKEGWELPLDPLSPESTVGGLLATAATGPRVQAFGRVADAVLGLEVLGADGEMRKCGGRVVKNVTGYDLAKLYCGSSGALGVLLGAWLRLRPAPARVSALLAPSPVSAEAFEEIRALRDWPTLRVLTLASDEATGRESLYIELGGSAAEVAAAREALAGITACEPIGSERIADLGNARRPVYESFRPQAEPEAVTFRAAVLGSALGDFVGRLRDRGFLLSADLGLGTVFGTGRFESFADFVALRRAAEAAGGYLSVLAMPETWRGEVDPKALGGAEARSLRKIKDQFDPGHLLNPGIFGAGT